MSQTSEPPPRQILLQKKDHLPHDIVLNILANLPVKSVLRFSTIRSFIGGYDHTFKRISEYPIPSALTLSRAYSACNGLVCLAQYGRFSTNIHLWNPSIRKFKRLSDSSLPQYYCISIGFAYDSKTNDYKVVKISQKGSPHNHGVELGAEVYTLSSNSWRRVGMSLTNNDVGLCQNQTSIFVSGALHWLGRVIEAQRDRYMILSFDVNNDKFGEIAIPDGQQQLLPQGLIAKPRCLMVFKGKLAFITRGFFLINDINEDEYRDFMSSHSLNSCFIWRMGEYGVHESWSKLFFVQFDNAVDFLGCTSRGELLVKRYAGKAVVSLDLETLHEKDLHFRHVPQILTTFMESLVLLDGATDLSG
ncbi:F-box/kelch-repeat protein At3g23880-like [Quercus robur]|uniref:F-box/kelch-repeat protein At3g23880-like n=1 Tax=Quercus robur TaxID=38942 RepID=UPI0021638C64|nr:F-box/kelch-repeat protein At3g23880-like [Quercus robur]